MADVRTVVARLTLDLSQFNTGMNQAERNLDGLGKRVGAVGLAAGAGLAFAVKKSVDFEAAMSAVGAATMASGKQLEALRDAAIRYGASTQYTATEAAQGITEMAKAGVSSANILGGGLKGALDLAAAGQISVADSAQIAATALTQYGLAGKDLPHVADLLAAAAGKAQGGVSDLAGALKYAGPVAHGMGVSIEETTAVLAEFASQGVLGEQAGTSFRGVLLALTAPSEIAAKKMQQLGISVYDAQGRFIGMQGVAKVLQDRLSGLTEAQRNAALGTIFGNNQITAATILYQGGAKAVQDWMGKVNDAGFATEQAARLTDNLKGDVERLGGAFDTALITSGGKSNGVLREMVQQATGLLDIYNSLPGPVQTTGTAIGGAASAVGLLGGGLLLAAPRITATKRALAEMGRTGEVLTKALSATRSVILGPWGIALAAGAVGLGILADKHAKAVQAEQQFKDALDATTGAITDQAVALRAKELQDSGVLRNAARLGLSLQDVTLAATGNTDAITRLNAAQQVAATRAADLAAQYVAAGGSLYDLQNGLPQAAGSLGEQARQALSAANGMGVLLDQLDPYAAKSRAAQQAQQQLAAATGDTDSASKDAATSTGAVAGQLGEEATQAASAADKVDALKTKLDALNGVHLSARAAARDFQAAIDDASKALKDNGKTLDINTPKGRANQDSLDGIASKGIAAAEAIYAETHSETKMRASLELSRQAFIRTAEKMGLSSKAAKNLADKVLAIPKKAPIDVKVNGAAAAGQALDSLLTKQQELQRHVNLTYSLHTTGAGPVVPGPTSSSSSPYATHSAAGGYITGPGGPTEDRVPAMLSNGEYVVRASAVRHIGVDNLDRMNRYARGGLVGSTPVLGLAAPGILPLLPGLRIPPLAELIEAGTT